MHLGPMTILSYERFLSVTGFPKDKYQSIQRLLIPARHISVIMWGMGGAQTSPVYVRRRGL